MKIQSFLPVLIAMTFVTIISCNQSSMKMGNDDMLAKNKATIQKIDDAFDSGDTTMVDSFLTADAVDHNPFPGVTGTTAQQIRKAIATYHVAFPDSKTTITAMAAEGDWVVQYGTSTATNSGSFMGMPASNKKVTFDIADAFRMKDGKIAEHWGMVDVAGMMQQMGMMPQQPMPTDTSMKKMDMPQKK